MSKSWRWYTAPPNVKMIPSDRAAFSFPSPALWFSLHACCGQLVDISVSSGAGELASSLSSATDPPSVSRRATELQMASPSEETGQQESDLTVNTHFRFKVMDAKLYCYWRASRWNFSQRQQHWVPWLGLSHRMKLLDLRIVQLWGEAVSPIGGKKEGSCWKD